MRAPPKRPRLHWLGRLLGVWGLDRAYLHRFGRGRGDECFITAMVFTKLGTIVFIGPILDDPDYLINVSANENRVLIHGKWSRGRDELQQPVMGQTRTVGTDHFLSLCINHYRSYFK